MWRSTGFKMKCCRGLRWFLAQWQPYGRTTRTSCLGSILQKVTIQGQEKRRMARGWMKSGVNGTERRILWIKRCLNENLRSECGEAEYLVQPAASGDGVCRYPFRDGPHRGG